MTEKDKHSSKHIEEIKEKFNDLLSEIKSLNKNDLKSLSQEYYTDIKNTLHVEEMKNSVDHSFNELENTIKETPLRSAALCVGIGFVLAKVLGLWKNG